MKCIKICIYCWKENICGLLTSTCIGNILFYILEIYSNWFWEHEDGNEIAHPDNSTRSLIKHIYTYIIAFFWRIIEIQSHDDREIFAMFRLNLLTMSKYEWIDGFGFHTDIELRIVSLPLHVMCVIMSSTLNFICLGDKLDIPKKRCHLIINFLPISKCKLTSV